MVVCKENCFWGPHTWVEVHNNGHLDTAAGFYPNSSGEWGLVGQVLIGRNEHHSTDEVKQTEAVFRVAEEDAVASIQDSYYTYHNTVIYEILNPGTTVCWDYTNYVKQVLENLGYEDISAMYFPANLSPDEETYNTIDDYVNHLLEQ